MKKISIFLLLIFGYYKFILDLLIIKCIYQENINKIKKNEFVEYEK
jgi:hypothetical protein